MMLRLDGIVLGAAGISVAASALILLSQQWHGKHTLDHDLDGVQKFHTTAVPRIGGMAIFAALFMVSLFGHYFPPTRLVTASHLNAAMLLLIASLPAFLAGIVEDLTKKVSVRIRLVATMASALAASVLLGATVNELNIWGVDALLAWTPAAVLITAVVVAGGVNAVNIIDGFNGLAGSTVVVMLAALGLVAWHVGDTLVLELACAGFGAALGFLLINYPTGRLFLGDGGAYLLGFWVAEGAVLLIRNSGVNAWQLLAICAFPVIELVFSIYRRKFIRKTSPGSADGLHLHTLVYRRVVPRLFRLHGSAPWMRNAAVAIVMIPGIASAALLSAIAGTKVAGAIVLVLAQVLIYLLVYARIVRGYWGFRSGNVAGVIEEGLEGRSSSAKPAGAKSAFEFDAKLSDLSVNRRSR